MQLIVRHDTDKKPNIACNKDWVINKVCLTMILKFTFWPETIAQVYFQPKRSHLIVSEVKNLQLSLASKLQKCEYVREFENKI
jgi:hypothetical protein